MSDKPMAIPLPFTFSPPFDKADEVTVTIWINSYRKRNGRPVIVDWSAKAFMDFITVKHRRYFLSLHNHHKLGIIRSDSSGPAWNVRVNSPAPEALSADMARKSKLIPIRPLRGVYRGDGRKMPGWALDASWSQVASSFEAQIGGYNPKPVAFCLPDATDKTFLKMFQGIQQRIASTVNHYTKRGYGSADAYMSPKYVIHVNPTLEHKRVQILSLNNPIQIKTMNGESEASYIVEPVHIRKAS